MSEQRFIEFNETINREILQSLDFMRATASGEMRASVLNPSNVIITETSFIKRIRGYAEFIDVGRGAGKPPPISAILDWLENEKYGFRWKPDERKKQRFAWAIRRTIEKKGSAKSRNEVPKTDIFNNAVQVALIQLKKGLLQDLTTISRRNVSSNIRTIQR